MQHLSVTVLLEVSSRLPSYSQNIGSIYYIYEGSHRAAYNYFMHLLQHHKLEPPQRPKAESIPLNNR